MFFLKSVTATLMFIALFVLYFEIFIYLSARAPVKAYEKILYSISSAQDAGDDNAFTAQDPWQKTNFNRMNPSEIVKYLRWENYLGCRFYQGK